MEKTLNTILNVIYESLRYVESHGPLSQPLDEKKAKTVLMLAQAYKMLKDSENSPRVSTLSDERM